MTVRRGAGGGASNEWINIWFLMADKIAVQWDIGHGNANEKVRQECLVVPAGGRW